MALMRTHPLYIWNWGALAMNAHVANCLYTILFLFMHFKTNELRCGEKYQSYMICNIGHSEITFYWSINTIMMFLSYYKGANIVLSIKFILHFLLT